MNMPAYPDSGAPKDATSDGSGGPESAEERADTDPMLNSANPYGAGWGAGWGASWADDPEPKSPEPSARAVRPEPPARPAERTPTPVLGDVELPSAPEPFTFPAEPARGPGPAAGRMPALAVGGLVAVAAVIGLVFWLVNRSPSDGDAQRTGGTAAPTTTPESVTASETATEQAPTRDAGAEARLMRMLPPGYPPGACKPADPQPGSVAIVNCGNNIDPSGPPSATYLVTRDRAALDAAFGAAVRPDAVVTCPGNIQSPGPWRRNATPQKVSGTLVCGVQDGVPTVAWTDTERMLVSVVRSDSPGPTLDQLYQWWSSHS